MNVPGGDSKSTSITLDTVVGAPSTGVADAGTVPASEEASPVESASAPEVGVPEPVARVETEVVNPFERVPVQPSAAGDLSIDEAAPMLLLPLGLALRA